MKLRIFSTPAATLAAVLVLTTFFTACSLQNFLTEAEKVTTEIGGILPLVSPFVCPFSAPACAATEAAVAIASPIGTALDGLFAKWAGMSAAAQPGFYPQLIAGAQSLSQSQQAIIAAAKVSNPASQSKINGELTAMENATIDLLTLLESNKAGTVSGMLEQLGGEDGPTLAYFNPLKTAGNIVTLYSFHSRDTLKLKNGAVIHTHTYYRKYCLEYLTKPSGDAQVDAIARAVAKRVKGF